MGAVQNIWLALPLSLLLGSYLFCGQCFRFCFFGYFFLFYRRVFLELKNQNVCFMFSIGTLALSWALLMLCGYGGYLGFKTDFEKKLYELLPLYNLLNSPEIGYFKIIML